MAWRHRGAGRVTPGLPDPGGDHPEGGTTSTDVTMRELKLETAELLPSRETLSCCGCECGFISIDVDVYP